MQLIKKDATKLANAVRNEIRRSFTRSLHYKNFVTTQRVEWKCEKSNRKRVSYRCKACKSLFSLPEINVDHISPIGRLAYRGLNDAAYFADLVYCPDSNLQILCKACHKVKSSSERKVLVFENALF